jgi:Mor family transcriptional regulator
MRTEEEAKYDLDERIFELYDNGMSIQSITKKLDTTVDYIVEVLKEVQMETS